MNNIASQKLQKGHEDLQDTENHVRNDARKEDQTTRQMDPD